MRRTIFAVLVMCVALAAWGQETVLRFKPASDAGWTSEDLKKTAVEFQDRLADGGIPGEVSADEKAVRVTLKNDTDIERVRRIAGGAGVMAFRLVAGLDETAKVLRDIDKRLPGEVLPFLKRDGERVVVPAEHVAKIEQVLEKAQAEAGLVPEGKAVMLGRAEPDDSRALYVVDREPLLEGRITQSAVARADERVHRNWKVLFKLTPDAATRFGAITEQNINRALAIVVDGEVLAAPIIRSKIGGSGEISGSFTGEEATDLATALKLGPLPLRLVEDK